MSFIYVLRLEGNRFYIGKTNDPKKRFEQHVEGKGSVWTKAYPVMEMEKLVRSESPFDEDLLTKAYMSKYGLDRVRGGSYVEMELSRAQKEVLTQELRGAKDQCKRCGRTGHFIKDCYAKTSANGQSLEESEESEESEEDSCYRCGRAGHYASKCYSKKRGYNY